MINSVWLEAVWLQAGRLVEQHPWLLMILFLLIVIFLKVKRLRFLIEFDSDKS